DLDVGRKVEAHFAKHGARFPDDPRAVLEILVPVGRHPDDRERGARAERAADHVLHFRRVLQHHEVAVVPGHREAQLRHRRAAIGKQALPEAGIHPGARDDASAILGDPFLLGQVAQLLHGFGSLEAALVERRLDRIDARFDARSALDDSVGVGHGQPLLGGFEITPSEIQAHSAERAASTAATSSTHRKPAMKDSPIASFALAWTFSLARGISIAASFGSCRRISSRTGAGTSARARRGSRLALNAWDIARPNTATARRPAVSETALLMPEAMPAWSRATELITVLVSGATVNAIPRPSTTVAGKNPVQ